MKSKLALLLLFTICTHVISGPNQKAGRHQSPKREKKGKTCEDKFQQGSKKNEREKAKQALLAASRAKSKDRRNTK